MNDFSGYKIKETKVVKDSLNKVDMHINTLENGIVRMVVVLPHKDGIARHIVFEVQP